MYNPFGPTTIISGDGTLSGAQLYTSVGGLAENLRALSKYHRQLDNRRNVSIIGPVTTLTETAKRLRHHEAGQTLKTKVWSNETSFEAL